MNKDFLLPYDFKKTESGIYQKWEASGFFNPDKLPFALTEKKVGSFTVVLPPPNITGTLHMGHALNAVIQDIIIRAKRMQGFRTLWLPGTDHAGIATQNVLEKHLKKEGFTRHDLGREKFLERIWEWKKIYGDLILNQLKKLGASCDWSRTRFTMDEDYALALREAFIHYYKRGWIYRGSRVVSWCSRCGTSLSDLELEYLEERGKLYTIIYPLKDGGEIRVATTRPETLLGDAAVAVHPDDRRYSRLIGKTAILPLQKREIPVIADKAVEKEFGTGAVKVTPAHDVTDAEIGERHQLSAFQIIDKKGRMTSLAGEKYEGLKISECRVRVVEDLKSSGLLFQEEDYVHNVAHCSRCGGIIEPLISLQWFLKMSELSRKAIRAAEDGRVNFYPERWKDVYLEWLKNVRDWCISRQIWWGHRLPVWQCKCQAEKNSEFELQKSKLNLEQPDDFIVSPDKPDKKCEICGTEYEQISDVLDTWFSSALWPFATMGWPFLAETAVKGKFGKENDLANYYPTQVLSTARDIVHLWVSRMVFSGVEFMGKEPFRDVIIHATVLNKEGKRMSKSLGTGVDPMDLMEKYGADAVRFALIWQSMGGQDIRWAQEHVLAGRKFANKLWNIARFVISVSESGWFSEKNKKPNSPPDEEILRKLENLKKEVSRKITAYDFGQALHDIYNFTWHEFADRYIESAKSREDGEAKEVLSYALREIIKLLHPFMPFVTEAIYQRLPQKNADFLMVEKWEE